MANPRVRRIADRIKVTVAELLERRIKDPRLGFVTITDVRVTGDTQHASVFYTVLGDEEEVVGSAAALESARGLIRSEVGKALGTRHVPTLEFLHDALPESARHLEELLVQAREADAAVAAAAAGATYAGEADPYKKPHEDDEDDVVDADDSDDQVVVDAVGNPGDQDAVWSTAETGTDAPASTVDPVAPQA